MGTKEPSSKKGVLTIVMIVSVGLHAVALLVFGAYKLVERVIAPSPPFEAPPIQIIPQREPEYTVNLGFESSNTERTALPSINPSAPSQNVLIPDFSKNSKDMPIKKSPSQ